MSLAQGVALFHHLALDLGVTALRGLQGRAPTVRPAALAVGSCFDD